MDCAESLGALLRELALLQNGLQLVRERMEANGPPREGVASLLSEIRGVARRLESAGDALQRALVPAPGDEASLVRWLEVRGRDRNVAATAVPLDIAPILREDLFKRVTTAVITSATLAGGDRFAFVRTQLGLDDGSLEASSAVFPSPFDYPRQALLAVPTDFPAPNVDPAAHFARRHRCHDRTWRSASDGGLFALFTSHRDVREVARELRARDLATRWPLLVHGEEPRDVLLRRFRESGRALLLGTASFWEGVDVAGRGAARARHRQAAVSGAYRAPHRGSQRSDRGAWRGLVPGANAPPRHTPPQAGIRPPHPHRNRPGCGGVMRSAGVYQGLRPRDPLGASARQATDRTMERCVTRAAGFLQPTGERVIRPGKIVCVGRNYLEHAKELGNEVPKEPLLFLKPPSSVIGTNEAIVLPPQSKQVEYEGEIGIRIGKRITRVTEDEARAAIAGIVAVNDVTARDLQKFRWSVDACEGV